LRLRQLDQLDRIAALVAQVRQTARDEAEPGREGRIGGPASFSWNARKQLELGINVLASLGGPELPACREFASGSTMTHLPQVVGAATNAFDEVARAATAVRVDEG
jgi:hypothetical protein